MLRFTFRGGIHPDDGKAMSKDKPIREVLPKGELVYPLSQHIGAPAKAIVAKGDHVLAGQKIAEAGGFVSANIFASVSGTVKAIEARLGVAGGMQESIVIENDGLYEEVEFSPERKLADISGKEIIEIIKEAGIVGMGGAGFPTHVKYMPKDPSAIDYIIVNCAECEPYLTSDYRRMMEEPEKIVGGLQAAMKIFDGRAKGVLAVEDNKKDAAAKLREAAKGMTTLALNAAIEAGRLGESGFSFLQAAESVRKLSEEYVQHIQIVEEFLAKAAEVYPKEDAAGQLEQLSERTRETADMAGAFCDRGQSDMASLKEQFTKQVELQQEQIAGMQDCIQKKEKTRERIEEQIEMIRKNHENSSKAAGEIEERLSLFYGKVL